MITLYKNICIFKILINFKSSKMLKSSQMCTNHYFLECADFAPQMYPKSAHSDIKLFEIVIDNYWLFYNYLLIIIIYC